MVMSAIALNLRLDMIIFVFLLQQIMKERWINAGFEDDELKPFLEPEADISDQKRIGKRKRHHIRVHFHAAEAFRIIHFEAAFY